MQATLTSCESSSMAQGAAKPAMSRQAFGSTRNAKVGAAPRGTRDRGPSLHRLCTSAEPSMQVSCKSPQSRR
jgi:hypothetical protein